MHNNGVYVTKPPLFFNPDHIPLSVMLPMPFFLLVVMLNVLDCIL